MRIPDELLYKYSDGLEFKRFFKETCKNSTTYAVYDKGDFKGVISFRDYWLEKPDDDLSINVMSLFLDEVKSGLGTKLLSIACKCGEEIGAEKLVIILYEQKIKEKDSKNKKRKYTKRKRIKVYKKIGKRLNKKVFFEKGNIIYKLLQNHQIRD